MKPFLHDWIGRFNSKLKGLRKRRQAFVHIAVLACQPLQVRQLPCQVLDDIHEKGSIF
jgi:hypothetical protein